MLIPKTKNPIAGKGSMRNVPRNRGYTCKARAYTAESWLTKVSRCESSPPPCRDRSLGTTRSYNRCRTLNGNERSCSPCITRHVDTRPSLSSGTMIVNWCVLSITPACVTTTPLRTAVLPGCPYKQASGRCHSQPIYSSPLDNGIDEPENRPQATGCNSRPPPISAPALPSLESPPTTPISRFHDADRLSTQISDPRRCTIAVLNSLSNTPKTA